MKVLIVWGTRPEIIKLAPVYFKLKEKLDVKILHTKQHDSLADDVLNFFNIKCDHDEKCILHMDEERRLGSIQTIMKAENPDIVIVQGDTFTTYAGAYTAFMLKKPVIHLEAGLRTYKRYSPYPEEIFRKLVTQIAEFHFPPTEQNKQNLIKEGIHEDRIFVAGNTVVDAAKMASKMIDKEVVKKEIVSYEAGLFDKINEKDFFVITAHRRENIGEPLKRICRSVKKLAIKYPNKIFIWLKHKNPNVREIILNEMSDITDNIKMLEALSYPTMLYLLNKSQFIMTDSGGLQEEVVSFQKPVIILREDTERDEVVKEGLGFLVGSDEDKIITTFEKLLSKEFLSDISDRTNPYGDGKTSDRILDFLQIDEVKEYLKNYPKSCEYKFNIEEL